MRISGRDSREVFSVNENPYPDWRKKRAARLVAAWQNLVECEIQDPRRDPSAHGSMARSMWLIDTALSPPNG